MIIIWFVEKYFFSSDLCLLIFFDNVLNFTISAFTVMSENKKTVEFLLLLGKGNNWLTNLVVNLDIHEKSFCFRKWDGLLSINLSLGINIELHMMQHLGSDIIYVAGNWENQAFTEMPRPLGKTQAFQEMPRHLRKFVIFLIYLRIRFWEKEHHQHFSFEKLNYYLT